MVLLMNDAAENIHIQAFVSTYVFQNGCIIPQFQE